MSSKKNDNLSRKHIVQQPEFRAKKKLSQNFLLDENIISNIVASADIDSDTGVIEIGPGLGALTKAYLHDVKKCLLYEVDGDLIPYLKGFFGNSKKLKLINEDVLKADINPMLDSYFNDVERIVLLSNLPYHITTPIIMKFLEEVEHVDSMILMMQLEVAKRLTSEPNTKDYNALSVIIQHQTHAKYLFKVSKNVFHPKPNVDSAVIRLDIKKNIDNKEYKQFYKFVHQCFSQRRKTLVNNLHEAYPTYAKDRLYAILESIGLNPMARAESLQLSDFESLYHIITNQ